MYHAELTHPQGARYDLTAETPSELAMKISRRKDTKSPMRDVGAIRALADEPDYLSWNDGWYAKVWKD